MFLKNNNNCILVEMAKFSVRRYLSSILTHKNCNHVKSSGRLLSFQLYTGDKVHILQVHGGQTTERHVCKHRTDGQHKLLWYKRNETLRDVSGQIASYAMLRNIFNMTTENITFS